jgi:protein phosphatase
MMNTTNHDSRLRADETLPTLSPSEERGASTARLDVAAASDVGRERQRNEDQYLVAHLGRCVEIDATSVGRPQTLTTMQGTLLVVADGMGGHGAGDLASAVTLDAFVTHSLMEMPWLGFGTPEGDAVLAADLGRFVADCQERLHVIAARKGVSPRLGTTFTAGYVHEDRLVVAHVGDSRAYYMRGAQLVRLTRDHTIGAAIAESAKLDPKTVGHQHILTNAIGGNPEVPRVELTSVALAAGDRVLLCSDGLHGVVDDARIAELLVRAPDARSAVAALVAEALLRGGPDNVTVVVAFG